MYTLHKACRACGSTELIPVFDLGLQNLANDFRREGEEHAGYAPLLVMFCPHCTLSQLSVVVRPEILYANYPYVTSSSATMQAHFQLLIADIRKETSAESVLEIGSNDGRFLSAMRDAAYSVSGVEPADNLALISRNNGIQTHNAFFCSTVAAVLPRYDIVIARHVFCHTDNWRDFVLGLGLVSGPETLICIEVPYVLDTLKNCEFDQIYHEHLSFLSIKAMQALLENTPWHVHRVIHYQIHGGAILLMLRHNDSKNKPVGAFSENITVEHWERFSIDAKDQINRLASTVRVARCQGKRVAALGASAKSTVWVNACGFTNKDIEFIADNTPQKQATLSPGSDIPIVDESKIMAELPDLVVLFAWNYEQEILEKFSTARAKGVRFIVPAKGIRIV